MTPTIATGELADFLKTVVEQQSFHKQLEKFTWVNEKLNERRFVKNKHTKLEAVSAEVETEVCTKAKPVERPVTRPRSPTRLF